MISTAVFCQGDLKSREEVLSETRLRGRLSSGLSFVLLSVQLAFITEPWKWLFLRSNVPSLSGTQTFRRVGWPHAHHQHHSQHQAFQGEDTVTPLAVRQVSRVQATPAPSSEQAGSVYEASYLQLRVWASLGHRPDASTSQPTVLTGLEAPGRKC